MLTLKFNVTTKLMDLLDEFGTVVESVPLAQAIKRKGELLHAAAVASGVRTVEVSPMKKHRNEVL